MNVKIENIFKRIYNYIHWSYDGLNYQARIIILTILGISVFVTLSAFLIVQNIQSNIDKQVLKLNHNLKATQILSQLTAQDMVLNYSTVKQLKNRLNMLISDFMKEHSEVSYIIITDNAGNVLSKSPYAHLYDILKPNSNKVQPPKLVPWIKFSHSKYGKVLTIAEPIQYNSNFFGWVWIGVPDTGFTIVGSRAELFVFLFEIFLLVWILSVIGAIVNSLIITGPVRKLEKGAKAISEGRFGVQFPLRGFLGKELTQLVKAFNKMSKRLKQYEESNLATLSSERNKFESVVMSIADGVIVLDKEDIIQIVNPTSAKLLNRSGDELLGQKAYTIWQPSLNKLISDYLSSIKSVQAEPILECKDFDLIYNTRSLKLFITPLYDSNNEKLGSVIVIHDRTKEVEVELIKQEFISNVSHELRTPITSIKCYVDTLYSHSEQIDTRTREEFLSIINDETDRLSKLVNDILELSRLESMATKFVLSCQDVYPAIEYAVKSTIVLANKKSIKLLHDIEKGLPQLNINQENIERVLINLISNAIKYTPGNGVVKLVVKRRHDEVDFQIIDNGIGIQEEHLPFIFERFYRIENKVHTQKGTGLGLTIVKKSVEQHGGKLSVKSKLGEGSIFEFSIPIPTMQIKDLDKERQITKTAYV